MSPDFNAKTTMNLSLLLSGLLLTKRKLRNILRESRGRQQQPKVVSQIAQHKNIQINLKIVFMFLKKSL